MEIRPIAYIHNDYKEKFGIPRQSGMAENIVSRIVFEPEYAIREAFEGIEDFNYIWLIWDFSMNHRAGFKATVRPPVLGGNEKMGVFATRSPFRPNSIGISSVKLLGVEEGPQGVELIVGGADLMDGTPIYDVKPYILSDCHEDASEGFAKKGHERVLDVNFPNEFLAEIPREKQAGIMEILKFDPRPSYHSDPGREYGVLYGDFNVKFTVNGKVLTVAAVDRLDKKEL